MWVSATGLLSFVLQACFVSDTQRLAHRVHAECGNASGPTIAGFASLGGVNQQISNMGRDLHSWLRGAYGWHLQIATVPLTVWDTSGTGTTQIDFPFLAPCGLVANLWDQGANI